MLQIPSILTWTTNRGAILQRNSSLKGSNIINGSSRVSTNKVLVDGTEYNFFVFLKITRGPVSHPNKLLTLQNHDFWISLISPVFIDV